MTPAAGPSSFDGLPARRPPGAAGRLLPNPSYRPVPPHGRCTFRPNRDARRPSFPSKETSNMANKLLASALDAAIAMAAPVHARAAHDAPLSLSLVCGGAWADRTGVG